MGMQWKTRFCKTDRVMTDAVSFYNFGNSSGDIKNVGKGKGKYYSLNAPFKDGLSDVNLRSFFRPVIHKANEIYQPKAVVLQCGADSLAGDPYGTFNLSIKGHDDCLQFVRSFNVPLLVLGGGGTSVLDAACCWCYETAVAVGIGDRLENILEVNELPIKPNAILNSNTQTYNNTRSKLLKQISQVMRAPIVQF